MPNILLVSDLRNYNEVVNYSDTSNRASRFKACMQAKNHLLFLLDRGTYYGMAATMHPVVQQANPGVPPVCAATFTPLLNASPDRGASLRS